MPSSMPAAAIAVPRHAIPGIGWLTYARDTEGNIFGMSQPDPAADLETLCAADRHIAPGRWDLPTVACYCVPVGDPAQLQRHA